MNKSQTCPWILQYIGIWHLNDSYGYRRWLTHYVQLMIKHVLGVTNNPSPCHLSNLVTRTTNELTKNSKLNANKWHVRKQLWLCLMTAQIKKTPKMLFFLCCYYHNLYLFQNQTISAICSHIMPGTSKISKER